MAAVKDERVGLSIFESEDTTNQDSVVAAVITMLSPTFEQRRVVRQDRDASNSGRAIQPFEFIDATGCKSITDVLLIDREDANRKIFGLYICLKACRLFGDTPENERWVQRNGIKAVNCDANFLTALVERRYDGNPGCETTERTAILSKIYFIR